MKLIVPLSGGKDSQATLLYCMERYGVENLIAVFCDTKWEHDLTYNHLDYLVEKTGVEFKILSSKKYDGFVDLAKQKKRFPSSTRNFCTVELKVKPMINWLLTVKDNVMIFQGMRNDESKKRSTMTRECRYFKYYFEPYKTNEMTIQEYQLNPPTTHRQKKEFFKAKVRLCVDGKNDEKYHTYRKKDVFAWCEKYADDVRRPFIESSANEVILYSLERDLQINPLYYKGASRVGCFPCINSRIGEMETIVEDFPDTIEKIKQAEFYTGRTFFAPDYIPKRYLTGFDPKSGKKICKIEDVVRYLTDKNVQIDLLSDLGVQRSCKNDYVICE